MDPPLVTSLSSLVCAHSLRNPKVHIDDIGALTHSLTLCAMCMHVSAMSLELLCARLNKSALVANKYIYICSCNCNFNQCLCV